MQLPNKNREKIMTFDLFAILDRVAGDFGPPFMAKNNGIAWRQYLHYVKDSPNQEDFQLYRLGTYYSETGVILPAPAPVQVIWEKN